MDLESMTKEQLIKEVKRLNKLLYHKKAARLSWKNIMKGCLGLRKGPGYWSNGHFLFINDIEIPKALESLNGLYISEIDVPLLSLYDATIDRTPTMPDQFTENEKGEIVMPNGTRFDKKYIKMLDKLVPGYRLCPAAPGVRAAATIALDDKFIGCLMPLGGKG